MKDENLTSIVDLFMKTSFLAFFVSFVGVLISKGGPVERFFTSAFITSCILVGICIFFVIMGIYITIKKGKKDGSSDNNK